MNDHPQLILPESLELAAKALCNHDARFNKWDDYTTRLVRESYRVQARIAITTWCEAEGITVRDASEMPTGLAQRHVDPQGPSDRHERAEALRNASRAAEQERLDHYDDLRSDAENDAGAEETENE